VTYKSLHPGAKFFKLKKLRKNSKAGEKKIFLSSGDFKKSSFFDLEKFRTAVKTFFNHGNLEKSLPPLLNIFLSHKNFKKCFKPGGDIFLSPGDLNKKFLLHLTFFFKFENFKKNCQV